MVCENTKILSVFKSFKLLSYNLFNTRIDHEQMFLAISQTKLLLTEGPKYLRVSFLPSPRFEFITQLTIPIWTKEARLYSQVCK